MQSDGADGKLKIAFKILAMEAGKIDPRIPATLLGYFTNPRGSKRFQAEPPQEFVVSPQHSEK
jgi:hypothetical protein